MKIHSKEFVVRRIHLSLTSLSLSIFQITLAYVRSHVTFVLLFVVSHSLLRGICLRGGDLKTILHPFISLCLSIVMCIEKGTMCAEKRR